MRHERKLDKRQSLFPNGRPVCESFAAMQMSAQPSIDAYNAAICGHPDISFSCYFSGTGKSNRCLVWPIVHAAGHCHILCQPQSELDFSGDDPARFWAPQSSRWSVPAVSSHSARPNRDEHREGLPCHRPPPSTSYLFRVWSFRHIRPFFCRGKTAVSKCFFPVQLAPFIQF